MVITKSTGKVKKTPRSKVGTGNLKKDVVSDVIIGENGSDNLETSVSVFTKTTNPKVVLQSEKIDATNSHGHQNICGRRFLKSVCLIILGVILLMIFFLVLKIYSMVNELYLLLLN